MRKFKYIYITLAAVVASVAAITYFLFFLKNVDAGDCLKDSRDIPSGYGPYAKVVETSCGDFGGSNVVEVFIAHDEGGKTFKSLVFKYDPSSFSGPLQVSWSGSRSLYISVERVDFVLFKEEAVDGYKINYAIASVGPKRASN